MPQPQRGTFADLYDTEKRVRAARPGRPRRKEPRKQVTLYLTRQQEEALSDMHHSWRKQFKVDRSDIAGLAIELLSGIAEGNNGLLDFQNLESLKVYISEEISRVRA
jgi:hypothetical protein